MSAIKDQDLAREMGLLLQQFMGTHGLSDSAMASRAGSSTSAVRTWRNGRVPNPPYRAGLSKTTGWDWNQPLDLLVQEMRRSPNGRVVVADAVEVKASRAAPNPVVGRAVIVAARHGLVNLLQVHGRSVDAFLAAPFRGGGDALDEAVKVVVSSKNHKVALEELKSSGVSWLSPKEAEALDEVFGS